MEIESLCGWDIVNEERTITKNDFKQCATPHGMVVAKSVRQSQDKENDIEEHVAGNYTSKIYN